MQRDVHRVIKARRDWIFETDQSGCRANPQQ